MVIIYSPCFTCMQFHVQPLLVTGIFGKLCTHVLHVLRSGSILLSFAILMHAVNAATRPCSVADPYHYPVLRLLYAVNSTKCIDPSSQQGTIMAIVECSYVGVQSTLQIMDNPSNSDGVMLYKVVRHLNINKGSSNTDLYYVILNGRNDGIQSDRMQITCYAPECEHLARYTSVEVTFCTKDSATARPYFVTVPRRWEVEVPVSSTNGYSSGSESTDIALFNAFTVVREMEVILCAYH